MRRLFQSLAPPRRIRDSRAVAIAIFGSAVCLVVGAWLLRSTGAHVERSEVVTVLSNQSGWRGRWRGQYVHRVRLPSGVEETLTFEFVYRPGERVKVLYSRNLRWGLVTVLMHSPCSDDCKVEQAQH
jgi:hypothetical protein